MAYHANWYTIIKTQHHLISSNLKKNSKKKIKKKIQRNKMCNNVNIPMQL